MTKSLAGFILILTLIVVAGCSRVPGVTSAAQQPSLEVVRRAELASKWEMKQITVGVTPEADFTIMLKLAEGDKVDGYFFAEQGSNIDFFISADTTFYRSQPSGGNSTITSDRFSFTASKAQGTAYSLTFHNPASKGDAKAKEKVFAEIIYPSSSSIFIPFETRMK